MEPLDLTLTRIMTDLSTTEEDCQIMQDQELPVPLCCVTDNIACCNTEDAGGTSTDEAPLASRVCKKKKRHEKGKVRNKKKIKKLKIKPVRCPSEHSEDTEAAESFQLLPQDLTTCRPVIAKHCREADSSCGPLQSQCPNEALMSENIIKEVNPSITGLVERNPCSRPKLKSEQNFAASMTYLEKYGEGPSSLKRGNNGWEESLRPRPAQVNHYQSILEARKRKAFVEQLNHLKLSRTEESDYTDGNFPRSSSNSSIQCKSRRTSSPKFSKKKRLEDDLNDSEVKVDPNDLNESIGFNQEDEAKPQQFDVGYLVWGKLGSTRWWPALVVCGGDCGQQVARAGHVWVFWLGDHKISELPEDKLCDFVVEFKAKFTDTGGKFFKKAVIEAVKELWLRAEKSLEEDAGDDRAFLSWAKSGFLHECEGGNPFQPNPERPIPKSLSKHLERIKGQFLQALHFFDLQAPVQFRFTRAEQMDNKDSALKKVHQGKLQITEVCIACDSSGIEIVTQHPLVEGGLCRNCKEDVLETMFAYEEDGTSSYCVICGQAGELLICDNPDCKRCYCTGCVEIMVATGAHTQVLQMSPWLCYMCHDYDPTMNGLICRKGNWQRSVMELFQPQEDPSLQLSFEQFKDKRPIRVLSLFDGIGTGRLVLDQMGLCVEAYFASEIDQDAIHVATVQHGDNITHLGRIENLSDTQVTKLCPIDLVIGGSPCNDLSLVNPLRKGLYDPTGTGKLFFDFFRVLRAIQLGNKGRHVFWLYENVASMPQEYKRTISRFLQCQPAMLDSKYFSAQNRARYFWGNIPGIYSQLQPHLLEQNITLDTVLTPNLNRKATVEKIRTVTTRSNSLKQGKSMILPVTMDGEADVLWITELEQVFGFPRHYTDAGNIPLGRRQQLLGRAWSVPVIRHLFSSLRNFYSTSCPAPNASPTSTCGPPNNNNKNNTSPTSTSFQETS